MEEDRTANQRSTFSLSFTVALYISNGFGLRTVEKNRKLKVIITPKAHEENSFTEDSCNQ